MVWQLSVAAAAVAALTPRRALDGMCRLSSLGFHTIAADLSSCARFDSAAAQVNASSANRHQTVRSVDDPRLANIVS